MSRILTKILYYALGFLIPYCTTHDVFAQVGPNHGQQVKAGWTQFRGPNRDGSTLKLPEKLISSEGSISLVWEKALAQPGLAGAVATQKYVMVMDRNKSDTADIYRCFSSKDGTQLWSVIHPCKGHLDYSNAVRATPLIKNNRVYILNAFGTLSMVDLKTGDLLKQIELPEEYNVEQPPKWGYTASPLSYHDKLIVTPGSDDASMVALKLEDLATQWKSPGAQLSYASPVIHTEKKSIQIVHYDTKGIIARDADTGQTLWRHTRNRAPSALVSSPLFYKQHLISCGNDDGVSIYAYNAKSQLNTTAWATHHNLSPDAHTPVVCGDYLVGTWGACYVLKLKEKLAEYAVINDHAFSSYCSLITSDNKVLVTTQEGKLILMRITDRELKIYPRYDVTPREKEQSLFSHPAIVWPYIYVRTSKHIRCFKFPDLIPKP